MKYLQYGFAALSLAGLVVLVALIAGSNWHMFAKGLTLLACVLVGWRVIKLAMVSDDS